MPLETFYCPHCNRQLTKSAQAYVLGEMLKSKSGFIGFGELPPTITCPGCHGRIDSMKMIKGEYDIDPAIKEMFPLFGCGIIGSLIIFKAVVHWSWVASIIAGIIAGIIIEQLISRMIKSISGKKIGKK
jgi:uncharacterized protein YlaI